jgi:hypothetical protein
MEGIGQISYRRWTSDVNLAHPSRPPFVARFGVLSTRQAHLHG